MYEVISALFLIESVLLISMGEPKTCYTKCWNNFRRILSVFASLGCCVVAFYILVFC